MAMQRRRGWGTRLARLAVSLGASALLASGCSTSAPSPPPHDAAVPSPPGGPAPATAKTPSAASKRAAAQTAKTTKEGKAAEKTSEKSGEKPAPRIAEDDLKDDLKDELKLEEPEANPYSEEVTLKLSVTPPVKALVMWGSKQVAKVSPGNMDAEIVRPRGSGPVDLEIKADGYLPYHTRLYSDRSEKVGVRLYRAEDAPGLFGYKRSATTK